MKISVVIPTFNRASYIQRAINSVLAQSYTADEIIVVDDGSTDNTQELIKNEFANIIYVKQVNKGISAARNTGINLASSDWICLLDSDDSWQTNKLEKQVQELDKHPEYLICHTNETWYRNGEVLNQGSKHEKSGGHIFQRCLPLCAISPSSVMIHKIIFDTVGLFDESLPACEDYDMWLRICCKYPVLFLDEALTNKYGGHDDQLSRKYWGMDRFRIIALEKIIESNDLNEINQQAAINMLLSKIRIFLKGAEKHGENEYCERFRSLLIAYARDA
jgi:glycosyltransferase involved in cell wall biosynthesis